MSDNEPVPPKGAHLIGRAIVMLGWLLFAAAAGLIAVMIYWGSLNGGGIILAVLIAICGGAALALGHNVENSRVGKPPTYRG